MTKTRLHRTQDMIGRTVKDCVKTVMDNHYEALKIVFTDDTEIFLIGGGYEGVGDYIEVAQPKLTETL